MEPEIGLSLRDLVLEVRADVKALRNEQLVEMTKMDGRVKALEGSGIALKGAWATLGIVAATLSGALGLALGVYAIL